VDIVVRVISLQSGSNGNCIYVEADSVRLLLDAGLSGSQVSERLASRGCDVARVDAVLISHDHSDHARCMGVYHRKFGIPVYVTAPTLQAAKQWHKIGQIADLRHFTAGSVLDFGRVSVETISTPHDGVDGVGFVIDDGHCRLGVLTDLGHVFNGLADVVASLDAVVLESNYDPEMLARGPYPFWLQERIRGSSGHLSNFEAAELLLGAGNRLKWACLAHLSEHNNRPELALATHHKILAGRLPLCVATRHGPTDILEV
jgi:phosphoribosyl 1,2-cyclic phosphodiesterase